LYQRSKSLDMPQASLRIEDSLRTAPRRPDGSNLLIPEAGD